MRKKTMSVEMKFPVVAHHRVIVNATSRDDATVQALFKSFDLVEPIAIGNTSSGGKYLSYGISVRFGDASEMARFDEALKAVPGLKMVL